MRSFRPETMAAIENAVPVVTTATALDVWKGSGNISHQTVKMALRDLVDRGRVLRTQERYQIGRSTRQRARYQRVPS